LPLHNAVLGSHAFAIIGYDESGFLIQNSWGVQWGRRGFARISYDDWLVNGIDVWVAQLGVPIIVQQYTKNRVSFAGFDGRAEFSFHRLRP
ncbi:C1 family peptidase, partial [Enterococcus casseliflavus]|uniref:C1 family peptidase n=1 Tax=Enterococcus casseliflavus TaxID=37734 RepID=UPI003D13EF07